ncbi:unnamed protein product, partial [marine sediment metagenome]
METIFFLYRNFKFFDNDILSLFEFGTYHLIICKDFEDTRRERGDVMEQKEEDGIPVIRVGRTESLDETTD